MGPGTVRAATRADVPALARVMSRAFFDESQFVWLQPNAVLRSSLLGGMFRLELQHVHPIDGGGHVLPANGGLLGGAVWAPPGRWKAPMWRQLRGTPRLFLSLGRGNLRGFATRGKTLQDALEEAHPVEPHWYLAALGVDPDAQGQGVGAALMRAGLDRCDDEGAHAYLECVERLVPTTSGSGSRPGDPSPCRTGRRVRSGCGAP